MWQSVNFDTDCKEFRTNAQVKDDLIQQLCHLKVTEAAEQLSFPVIKIHSLLMGATGRFHIDPHSHHTTPQVNLKCPGNKADDALLIRLL